MVGKGTAVVGVVAVKNTEVAERIQIYDAEPIPPLLRTFYKDQIAKVESRNRSTMPTADDSIYTREELAAIVAYLKSGTF